MHRTRRSRRSGRLVWTFALATQLAAEGANVGGRYVADEIEVVRNVRAR